MALKNYNPTSPARRALILVDRSGLYKGGPVKSLTEGKRKTGGRNNKGHVTSRGIAGGHKQRYRVIDFKRRTWDVEGTVERIEYDPNRTAFIALVNYGKDDVGKERVAYIIAPQRLAVGDKVIAGKKTDVKPGNAMELGSMPVGTIVHNVEMKPGKGGQIARSAGTYVQVVGRDRGLVIVLRRLWPPREVARQPIEDPVLRGLEGAADGGDELIALQGRAHVVDDGGRVGGGLALLLHRRLERTQAVPLEALESTGDLVSRGQRLPGGGGSGAPKVGVREPADELKQFRIGSLG